MIHFELQDIPTIFLLVFLEGILSVDNALAIALIAKSLPKELQRKALTYGLVGAVVFRIAALFAAEHLMQWNWVKFVGGGYLLFIALKHWVFPAKPADESEGNQSKRSLNFWKTVALIELTDIAFAADSILAAVAISKKLWVVITGGILGLIAMRFAATMFLKLLEKFPNFEHTAYLLVFGVGAKLVIDGFHFPGVNFHSVQSPAFWAFWLFAIASIGYGFLRRSKKEIKEQVEMLKKESSAVHNMEK